MLFQDGAHDGFHEAIGDTVNLSVTPAYLHQIGLVGDGEASRRKPSINQQMKMALDKVAFLPFGKLIDRVALGCVRRQDQAGRLQQGLVGAARAIPGRGAAGARAAKRISIRARSTTSPATRRTRATSCRSSCSSSSTRRCAMRPDSKARCTSARSSAAPKPASSYARHARARREPAVAGHAARS